MSLAFVFPGQGSQAVGMGASLAQAFVSARQVFEEVDDALGQKLSKLMWEGPEEDLTLTENAQPALMAVSLAVARALKAEFGVDITKAAFVAGHSLGEYSALAAADAIALAQTARLLRLRGQALQRHAAVVPAHGVAGLDGQEPVIGRHRLGQLAEGRHGHAAIVVGGGEIGQGGDDALEQRRRLRRPSRRRQRHGAVVDG